MVVDFALPDMSGFDLLERLKKELGLYDLPIIVYTAKEMSPKEETRLRKLSESIIIKNGRSPERLLAETSLFLHRASAKLPPEKRREKCMEAGATDYVSKPADVDCLLSLLKVHLERDEKRTE